MSFFRQSEAKSSVSLNLFHRLQSFILSSYPCASYGTPSCNKSLDRHLRHPYVQAFEALHLADIWKNH